MGFVIRGKRMIILSTGKRISGEFSGHMMKFFYQLPGSSTMVAKRNDEHIIIAPSGNPDDEAAYHIYSLPDSPTKTRGITAQYLVFEEASYISEKMYTEIALPLDAVDQSAIIAISSPPDNKSNYFYKFFNMRVGEGTIRRRIRVFVSF
jgi:hypothetical protein